MFLSVSLSLFSPVYLSLFPFCLFLRLFLSVCLSLSLSSPCPLSLTHGVQYELRLVASDNLNENYTTVVIHVNDVNDNPPVFDRPTYETQITEEDDRNLPKGVLEVNTSCVV